MNLGKPLRGFKALCKSLIPEKYMFFFNWKIKREGKLSAYLSLAEVIFKHWLSGDPIVTINIPDSNVTVRARPLYPDIETFDCVFEERCYDIAYKSVKYVVDAGAHIGLSAIFYALKYPDAKILAIEPDDGNYELLVSNTRNFPGIKTLKAGLWSHRTNLGISNPEDESWGFQVVEKKSGLKAITVQDAMRELDTEYVDLMKINIEGSEVEVLSSSRDWIDNVRFMLVSLHDDFRPGCTEALEKAISRRGFDKSDAVYSTLIYNPDCQG